MLCGCSSSRAVAITDPKALIPTTHTNDDSGVYMGEDSNQSSGERPSHTGMADDSTPLLGCHDNQDSGVLKCDQAYPGCFAWSKSSYKVSKKSDMGTPVGQSSKGPLSPVLDRAPSMPVLEIADCGVYPATPQQTRMCQAYRGQLKLAVYVNYGLLTVHIMESRHLWTSCGLESNAYVKVSLVPDDTKRTKCKTVIIKDTNCPVFNEKFSFELIEGDTKKRLLVSVWHKDSHHSPSELLGCMSFGVKHVVQKKTIAQGWYYLLSEHMGKRKHLHVNIYKNSSGHTSDGSKPTSSESAKLSSPHDTEELKPSTETLYLLIEKAEGGFGFTMTGDRPAHVLQIKPGSPCDVMGLQPNDVIIGVDEHDVSGLTADTVARVLRQCESKVKLQVQRTSKPPDILYGIPQRPQTGAVHPTPNTATKSPHPFHGQKHTERTIQIRNRPAKAELRDYQGVQANQNGTDNPHLTNETEKRTSGGVICDLQSTVTGAHSNTILIDDEEYVLHGNETSFEKVKTAQNNYENVFQQIKPPISNLAPEKHEIRNRAGEKNIVNVHNTNGLTDIRYSSQKGDMSQHVHVVPRSRGTPDIEQHLSYLPLPQGQRELWNPAPNDPLHGETLARHLTQSKAEDTQANEMPLHRFENTPAEVYGCPKQQMQDVSQPRSYVAPPPYSKQPSAPHVLKPGDGTYTSANARSNDRPAVNISNNVPVCSVPNTVRDVPRVGHVLSAQGTGYSVPNVVHAVQGASRTLPNVPHAVSNTSHFVPNASQAVPNVPHVVPNASHTAPNAEHIVTNAAHALRSTTYTLPDSLPAVTHAIQNAVHALPNVVHGLPNTINTVPNTINTVPNTINTVPNTVNTVPNTMHLVPSELHTVPHAEHLTQNAGYTSRSTHPVPNAAQGRLYAVPNQQAVWHDLGPGHCQSSSTRSNAVSRQPNSNITQYMSTPTPKSENQSANSSMYAQQITHDNFRNTEQIARNAVKHTPAPTQAPLNNAHCAPNAMQHAQRACANQNSVQVPPSTFFHGNTNNVQHQPEYASHNQFNMRNSSRIMKTESTANTNGIVPGNLGTNPSFFSNYKRYNQMLSTEF